MQHNWCILRDWIYIIRTPNVIAVYSEAEYIIITERKVATRAGCTARCASASCWPPPWGDTWSRCTSPAASMKYIDPKYLKCFLLVRWFPQILLVRSQFFWNREQFRSPWKNPNRKNPTGKIPTRNLSIRKLPTL